MQTKYTTLAWHEDTRSPGSWICRTLVGAYYIGEARYSSRVSQYRFRANEDAFFVAGDLTDIAHFLQQLNGGL